MRIALPGWTLRRLMRRAANSRPARCSQPRGPGDVTSAESSAATTLRLRARRCTRLIPRNRYNRLPTTGDSQARPIHETAEPGLRLCASTCRVTPAASAKCAIDRATAMYGTNSAGTPCLPGGLQRLALQLMRAHFAVVQLDGALKIPHLVGTQ